MEFYFGLSLCLSAFVVLVSIIPLTLGRIKAGYSIENMSSPRALFDELPDFGKRAVWCHQNCWESIALQAPATLLCLVAGVDSNLTFVAALLHPFIRLVYIFAYICDFPIIRGLSWVTGIFSTVILYKEGLSLLI